MNVCGPATRIRACEMSTAATSNVKPCSTCFGASSLRPGSRWAWLAGVEGLVLEWVAHVNAGAPALNRASSKAFVQPRNPPRLTNTSTVELHIAWFLPALSLPALHSSRPSHSPATSPLARSSCVPAHFPPFARRASPPHSTRSTHLSRSLAPSPRSGPTARPSPSSHHSLPIPVRVPIAESDRDGLFAV